MWISTFFIVVGCIGLIGLAWGLYETDGEVIAVGAVAIIMGLAVSIGHIPDDKVMLNYIPNAIVERGTQTMTIVANEKLRIIEDKPLINYIELDDSVFVRREYNIYGANMETEILVKSQKDGQLY